MDESKKMIERYSREEMSNIWTDQNRYEAWLEVEILACEAWSELGHIRKANVRKNSSKRKGKYENVHKKLNKKRAMML